MIAIVVALAFIVLMIAFRSVLVPAKAAVMNLLSVAASYGVLTAVFQLGWLHSLIGLDHSIPIVSFVPLLMFAILFGLSMDYEVFLLTQMREHYKASGDAKEAVVEGLANTGRVITSAAAIMVCVFTSFVLNGNPLVKEFGVGLAVAIAIDATIVRCLLVPGGDGPARRARLVAALLDGPAAPPYQHRGGGILCAARRRGDRAGCRARARGYRFVKRLTDVPSEPAQRADAAAHPRGARGRRRPARRDARTATRSPPASSPSRR